MSADPRPLPATYAAAVFKGTELDPDLVSAIMEQAPTLAYRRGDHYLNNDIDSERRFGLWIYSTRNIIHSASLKRHLAALEDLILGTRSAWPDRALGKIQDLLNIEGVSFRVDVYWYGAADAAIPTVSKSFQYIVEAAGGTVETDFHRDGDETRAA